MNAPMPPNTNTQGSEKSIGDIIRQANNLSPDQVEQVVAYQRQNNVKFGEAAVALGFAKREDVLWALSQQFHYPYSASPSDDISAELVVASEPFGEAAEVFRDLRSQLITNLFNGEGPRRALAVVSSEAGDGKSYFAANIAVAFSQLGGRTLLVDADMRTPRQHEVFGVQNGSGLSTILSGRSETNVIRPVADLPSLYLLPVGVVPPNPTELVQRPAFTLLINELLSKFDYVVVDTPAASHGSDARVIAGACGAAVVVGRKGKSKMEKIQKLIASVQKTSAKVVGAIMNDH
jgi:chain length determinant protein tyrosine kinase EpsG